MSSPFDEAKYNALLKGLEVSEVRFSELIQENSKFRIDDEYFNKKYINSERLLKNQKYVRFSDIIDTLTDFHSNGSYESIAKVFELLDTPNYAYMVRTTDLETMNYTKDVKYITENCYNFLSKSKLFGGELLINKIGSPGRTYLMPKLNKPVSLGMNLFMVRVKKDSGFNESFLYIFFNTEIGKNIIFRKVNGTVPLTIDKESIKSLKIPCLTSDFQQKIESLVQSAHAKLAESKSLYAQAEDVLLSELGLKDWQPKNESVSVKKFSDFTTSNRLDAEYYEKKYDEIENAVKSYKGGYFNFGETIEYIFTGEYAEEYKSKADNLIFYVRSLNMKNGRIETDDSHYVSPNEFKKVVKTGNIITARVGTIGIFAEVDDTLNNAACSDNILCFNLPEQYNPAVYTMLLNSKPIFELVDRLARGSVQQRLNQETLRDLILPILSQETQKQIAELIQRSFALRQESKQLLEEAKKMVEKEIEEGSIDRI